MTKSEIKSELIKICRAEINRLLTFYEERMEEEQKTANMYKGAMESRYDTFKEEVQERKNMHAVKADNLLRIKSVILSSDNNEFSSVIPGAVVETSFENYFILSFLFYEPIIIDGKEFYTISLDSPIGKAITGKRQGETIIFNGNEITINDIY